MISLLFVMSLFEVSDNNVVAQSCAQCYAPSGDASTSAVRQSATLSNTQEDFVQTLSVTGNANGEIITEEKGATGLDSCYWSQSPYVPFNNITGGTWSVGTAAGYEGSFVTVGTNQWGPDIVGYSASQAKYYQIYRPKAGLSIPCGATINQLLTFQCTSSSSPIYFTNALTLTSTINATTVQDCREGVCSPLLSTTSDLPGSGGASGTAGNESAVVPTHQEQARIEHHALKDSVTVRDARPLRSAVEAVSRLRGDLVDYEDPPYSFASDLIDATDPAWRSTHPGSAPFMAIAGQSFVSEFPNEGSRPHSEQLDDIYSSIMNAYNATPNPGRFTLRIESPDRVSLVGTGMMGESGSIVGVSPILDTYVTFAPGVLSLKAALQEICTQLTSESRLEVKVGTVSASLLDQTRMTLDYGETSPARKLLEQMSDASKYPLIWSLLWEPNERFYALNVTPVEASLSRKAEEANLP